MTEPCTLSDSRYQGFNLRSVCWGYRDIFEKSIRGLFAEGLLGNEREEVTRAFFSLLKRADQSCYDHVLKEFLSALTPRIKWIFDIPSIFEDIVETGHLLAASKLYYGIGFFRILGEGGLGDTPARMRHGLTLCRRLLQENGDLAFALLRGYGKLFTRLQPEEIERYVHEGLRIHAGNTQAGQRFMAAESKASENTILILTQECRLEDIKDSLQRLLRALTGFNVEVEDFGQLDTDDLIKHGSRMITLYRRLYLPARIRHFSTSTRNRDWYRLCAIASASMLQEQTFAALHGHPEFESVSNLVGSDIARINLFTMLEYLRGLHSARRRWPGCRRLIDFGLMTEFSERPPENEAEALFQDASSESPQTDCGKYLARISAQPVNAFATCDLLDTPGVQVFIQSNPGLASALMRPFAFLPDFRFPGKVSVPPANGMLADMKDAARQPKSKKKNQDDPLSSTLATGNGNDVGDEEKDCVAIPSRYWYPEWNQSEGDYYENWCGVVPMDNDARGQGELPERLTQTARQVRRVFERLKPDLARTERRLESGDQIDTERLVSYRILARVDADPRIDFYEKPMILHRDLAVLILMDISGSTGEAIGADEVLEIEKHATLILGQGLATLGDRFAVAGFSSNGREQCEYYLFKDFESDWDEAARARIMGAYPRNSTRMGAALRHSGHLLSRVEAKQRLILLITDGKPMDSGYDPHSRYAQHDVRMACMENEKQSVCTFAISTEKNSLTDMEIMFPHRRYAILPDIRRLPDVLPRVYLRIAI